MMKYVMHIFRYVFSMEKAIILDAKMVVSLFTKGISYN